MNEPAYQRLAQSAFSSLWLGPDHLLLVNSTFCEESYKRFYFRDIHAITLRKSSLRTIWNAVLSLPLGICLIGMAVCAFPSRGIPFDPTAPIVWSIIFGLFLLPFGVNNFMGTGCACYLRTAVQNTSLPALRRMPKARKVFDKIRPHIVAVQGQLTAAEVSAHLREAAVSEAAASQAQPPKSPEPPVLS